MFIDLPTIRVKIQVKEYSIVYMGAVLLISTVVGGNIIQECNSARVPLSCNSLFVEKIIGIKVESISQVLRSSCKGNIKRLSIFDLFKFSNKNKTLSIAAITIKGKSTGDKSSNLKLKGLDTQN